MSDLRVLKKFVLTSNIVSFLKKNTKKEKNWLPRNGGYSSHVGDVWNTCNNCQLPFIVIRVYDRWRRYWKKKVYEADEKTKTTLTTKTE